LFRVARDRVGLGSPRRCDKSGKARPGDIEDERPPEKVERQLSLDFD
jgi:hypothetical protein